MDPRREQSSRFDTFNYHQYPNSSLNDGYGPPPPPPPPQQSHQIPPPPPRLREREIREAEITDKEIQVIVNDLKEKGTFDKFRHKCLNDFESTNEYQKVHTAVSDTISSYLASLKWTATLNGQQARDTLRKRIMENREISAGIENLLDEIVEPLSNKEFHSTVEEAIYIKMGLPLPPHLGPDNVDLVEMDEDNGESPPPPPGDDENQEDDGSETEMESEEESPAFEAIGLSPPHYMPMSPLTPPEMKYSESSRPEFGNEYGDEKMENTIEETEAEEMEYDPEAEWSAEAADEASKMNTNMNIISETLSDNSKEPPTPIYETSNSSLAYEAIETQVVVNEEIGAEKEEINFHNPTLDKVECVEESVVEESVVEECVAEESVKEMTNDKSEDELEDLDEDALEQKLLQMKQMLLQLDAIEDPQSEEEEFEKNGEKEQQHTEVKVLIENNSTENELVGKDKQLNQTDPEIVKPSSQEELMEKEKNEDEKEREEVNKEMFESEPIKNHEDDEIDREIQSISPEKETLEFMGDQKSINSDSDYELRPYSPEDYDRMVQSEINSAQAPIIPEFQQHVVEAEGVQEQEEKSGQNLRKDPLISEHEEISVQNSKSLEPEEKTPPEFPKSPEQEPEPKTFHPEKSKRKVSRKRKIVEIPTQRLTRRSSRNSMMSDKSEKSINDSDDEEVRFLFPIEGLELKIQLYKEIIMENSSNS